MYACRFSTLILKVGLNRNVIIWTEATRSGEIFEPYFMG